MLGLGNLGNLASLMRGAQELQRKLAELQERLAEVTAEGDAGGGMVRVVANARGEVMRVELDPQLWGDDREMAQELIAAATNLALARARERGREEMANILGGLGLPAELAGLSTLVNPGG